MGFLKDLRNVQKQAKEMTPPEYRGMGGMMRMSRDGMATMSQTLGDMNAEAQKAQHLMANGRQGTATVVALAQTGTFVNDNPQVELQLDVTVEGLALFFVERDAKGLNRLRGDSELLTSIPDRLASE